MRRADWWSAGYVPEGGCFFASIEARLYVPWRLS
jgi:hypothetical protein